MPAIRRILHATDFSATSQAALNYAQSLAEAFNAELHLLFVAQDLVLIDPTNSSNWVTPANSLDEVCASAQPHLNELLSSNWKQHHKTVTATRIGMPHIQIIDYAKCNNIDVIVVGTHGRAGLKHLVLGSVAEQILRHAECPVLTVRA